MKTMIPALLAVTLAGATYADTETVPLSIPQVGVILPAARDVNSPGGLPLRMLFDFPVRDPNICLGHDGNFYFVGTTESADGHGSMWDENDGVRMWRSRDLVHWEKRGFVWTFDRDGTWSKEHKKSPWVSPHGELRRALWAPEIHYLKGTYWIPYSMNYSGTGILKSTSGKPEGPYVDIKKDGPLTDAIDPSMFEDTDGKVYMLWADYNIALMKDDMSGLAEPPRKVQMPKYPWGEGIFMVKNHGKYIFINSGTSETTFQGQPVKTYDCYSAVSDSIYGPYTAIYRAIPHAGHNNLFQDTKGNWWSSYFGSGDPNAPWEIKPGVLPVTIRKEGHVSPKWATKPPVWRYSMTAPAADWASANFHDNSWSQGPGGFGDPAIFESGPVTIVRTPWKSGEVWLRKTFTVKVGQEKPALLYLRHTGDTEVFVNGKQVAHLTGADENYEALPLADPDALRAGRNTIAVHATAPADKLPYIDVGLIDKAPPATR
ncbi:hypothetical protein CCAX7_56500 [Capsulimonas corticalis]|uniref:Uncharacterized protein n=1 Tax=Capsulimonas corticalis TaxID=2219043 RepID=A0A402D0H3_9BACT|nr:family 43 glycosylhydrolase [Capsulimonas corticalis]BDI33599.1 hypothetical protein CCAX7_56500 [Capsulimonas corticalis]